MGDASWDRSRTSSCSARFLELTSAIDVVDSSVPIAPVEPVMIRLVPTGDRLGRLDAPCIPLASTLSLRCTIRSTLPSRPVTFRLTPPTSDDANADALAALASVTRIHAALELPIRVSGGADASAAAVTSAQSAAEKLSLPVTYAPSVAHGCVLISVLLSGFYPEGSSVVIRKASVAGEDMLLRDAPLQVPVMYNHSAAPMGDVYTAAGADNVPALIFALMNGASTEEASEVRW
jgi:hypothetical protein